MLRAPFREPRWFLEKARSFQYHPSSPLRGVSRVGGCPSGQREQTVNLSAQPTEVQILLPPPLGLVGGRGSEQRSADRRARWASIAQLAEHFHGKEGVISSILIVGSIARSR